MAFKIKLSLAVLLFFFLALPANLALGTEEHEIDPELKTCKHQCMQQLQYTESDKKKCKESCEKYHQMKKEREREIEKEAQKRKEQEREEKGGLYKVTNHIEEQEEEEQQEEENPFVFHAKHFHTRVETEDGSVRVLQKFTEKLLRGIENFRLAMVEAKGLAFISPLHFDSETVLLILKGRAAIGWVKEDRTERFNLEAGDIIRIPAGTPHYAVNRNENEKLFIVLFHIPVSTHGEFEAFYGPGGRDPQSILTAFSWKVLEASLKTPRKKLERLFEKQEKGGIFWISREQVQALSKEREGPSIWPFGGQSRGVFNLFRQRPSISNQYGRLLEISPDDQRELEDLNLMLTFTNITSGSMTAPLYNSKATMIALVIDGEGNFEMACPHISSGSKKKQSSSTYQRISASLRPGVVFVVPAGHPFVTVASKKNNLQIICFVVNARGNKRLTFAGKNNIVSAMDRQAKELAFDVPAEKVDNVFDRVEQLFFPGPDNWEESEERGRAYA